MRHETVLRLIDRVYDAATNVDGWSVFLADLAAALGAPSAGLLQHQVRSRSGVRGIVTASSALDPEAARLYGERYVSLDPWARALAARRGFDRDFLFTSEGLVAAELFRRTEFYNDFSRHYDIAGNVGFGVATDPGVATTVTVLRHHRRAPFAHDALRLMEVLQPHVGRALRVHSRLHEATRLSTGLGAVLDRLQLGVILLSAPDRVLHANTTARAIAARRDGLLLDADGPAAVEPRERQQLRRLLTLAADRDHRGGGIVRLSRPSGKPPLVAFVSPLRNGFTLELSANPLVALFVSDPCCGPRLDAETLRRVHGLTAAEIDIARAIARGATVRDVAARRGLTLNTARWYVKQILQKTGTHTQVDLLRLLLTGPAAILPDGT